MTEGRTSDGVWAHGFEVFEEVSMESLVVIEASICKR